MTQEEREKKNSCFRVKNKKIILESTKGIKPNEEIYADYGPDYWPRSYKKKIFYFIFSKMGRKKYKEEGEIIKDKEVEI